MRWTTPLNSKSKVRRAGKILSTIPIDLNAYPDAFETLSNWRAAHAYPMHSVLIFLRRQARGIEKESIVVQRLKRTPSIISKLYRESHMDLDRMQDIAGCRAVLSSISKVRKLKSAIENSSTRNTLHNTKDYIETPKESGYRGIHLIYKYNGTKLEYQNLFIEIQLRSKVQHSWATAVEVVDIFTRQALKSNHGEEEWKDFFKVASAEFSHLEKCKPHSAFQGIDTKKELIRLTKKLKVISKLRAFSVTTQHIENSDSKDRDEHYLLVLNTEDSSIRYSVYGSSDLTKATQHYSTYEKQFKNDTSKNVVLVSTSSIKDLKKAYPNYFADTREFISNIEKCLE